MLINFRPRWQVKIIHGPGARRKKFREKRPSEILKDKEIETERGTDTETKREQNTETERDTDAKREIHIQRQSDYR